MNSRLTIIAAFALALGVVAAGRNAAQEDAGPSVRLVYHSDTRGYYRPCG
jgi:hypothetical protein